MARKTIRNVRGPKQRNVTQQIERAILRRAEHKNYINQQLATVVATAGAVINLSNTIIQGDNYNNRSGNTIRLFHQKLLINVAAVINSSTNRFILVRDLENNGNTPVVTDILDAASFVAGYSSLETVQQRRFVILKDWVTNNNINGEQRTSLTYTNSQPAKVYYNGPTAIASANGKGALFLLAIGSGSTAVFDFSWHGHYTDS